MRLTVLVPSEEYKSYAGARIRYRRIESSLAARGVELALNDIDRFDVDTANCDAVLISKCHDARSLVAATALSDQGKRVGIDLFDDYYSDWDDSRLVRYRSWLSQLVRVCDFALCSTEMISKVVEQYRPGLPTHLMNDPAPEHDWHSLSAQVEKKLKDARENQRLRVIWFGVGDNAYYPVGLEDLSAFGSSLGELTRSGLDVQLTILTNRRALTADGLALIARLPIDARIVEWSESAEHVALAEALLAFLPVNAQKFSRSKSLNRAVTALAAGCQVLSVGYPLYAALDPLIYRDSASFVADLEHWSLRLSNEKMSEYRRLIGICADAEREAQGLARFLTGLGSRPETYRLPISLVHGHSSPTDAHRMAQAVHGLSVASPYCAAPLDFDVVFRSGNSRLEMLVSNDAASRLLPHMKSRLKGSERIRGRQFHMFGENSAAGRPNAEQSLPYELATYNTAMREIAEQLNDAFGQCRMILSESSSIPFSVQGWAA